jgi:hypothetical protein
MKSSKLFKTCGLFWKLEDIFFGMAGGGGHKGQLLGKSELHPLPEPVDFAKQIGVYALYADFSLLYVGQVGGGSGNRLLSRLRQHANGDFQGRWNRFSWFGLRSVTGKGQLSKENAAFHPSRKKVLNHVEGIILQFAEPSLNSQEGKFGNDLERYTQVRSPDLGRTQMQLLEEISKKLSV